jgi:hypothetical protein
MVVSRPEVAERMLLAGDLPCPRCRGVLRSFGNGRTRTVRGIGADTVTVTPRRARCADCRVTQILLPTTLTVRRADSTEAIGTALGRARPRCRLSHDRSSGGPSPPSGGGCAASATRAPSGCIRRAVDRAAAIDRELLVRPAPQRTALGHTLNLLAGAALRYRDRFDPAVPVWALIGSFAHGRLLAPPHPQRS